MGREFGIIIFLIWFPQAIYQSLYWTYWWQVKEYRLDRFKTFINSQDGRNKLRLKFIISKIILLFLSMIFNPLLVAIIFVYLLLDLQMLVDLIDRSLRRPVFTQRAKSVFTGSIFAVLLIFLLLASNKSIIFTLIVGETLVLLSPAIGVFWTTFVVKKVKREDMRKAIDIIRKINPYIIGIAGSYGKTTTKDFVAHLLSQKYFVQKTKASENTVFGICRMIINELKNDTQVVVTEMGAYKKGEIKELTEIVRPNIAILTGIEPQHIELFGSLENIRKAKFEIVDALPKGGIAIFNLSNKECLDLYERAKKLGKDLTILGYKTTSDLSKVNKTLKPDIESQVLDADINGVKIKIKTNDYLGEFYVPVTGAHFVENLLAAILVARKMNISWQQIDKAIQTISLPEKTMRVRELKNGLTIIDDSYNSTPLGFESAVNYLSLFKQKKKIVITGGIIELGRYSKKIHFKLGKLLNTKVDKIIVTNREIGNYFCKDLDGKNSKFFTIERTNLILKEMEKWVKEDVVILLEGRQPQILINLLEKGRLS